MFLIQIVSWIKMNDDDLELLLSINAMEKDLGTLCPVLIFNNLYRNVKLYCVFPPLFFLVWIISWRFTWEDRRDGMRMKEKPSISYLSCASPLWSACEETGTDLHLTSWTSSSPPHSCKQRITSAQVHACIRHFPLREAAIFSCFHLHTLYLYENKCFLLMRTHPSLSISSVLKVNT